MGGGGGQDERAGLPVCAWLLPFPSPLPAPRLPSPQFLDVLVFFFCVETSHFCINYEGKLTTSHVCVKERNLPRFASFCGALEDAPAQL